jgi:hypothetical protein
MGYFVRDNFANSKLINKGTRWDCEELMRFSPFVRLFYPLAILRLAAVSGLSVENSYRFQTGIRATYSVARPERRNLWDDGFLWCYGHPLVGQSNWRQRNHPAASAN